MNEPSALVLEVLDVRVVASLGGRLNKHWLVESPRGKVVLRRWTRQEPESIAFERKLLNRLSEMGWPTATFDEPIQIAGSQWSLGPFLPGAPEAGGHETNPHSRGRLLARLHRDMKQVTELGRRPGWRRCEEILADSRIDHVLSRNEKYRPEEIRIIRWHLDRARLRIEGLSLDKWPSIPIHGDFAPWNLLYEDGRLTGILDFEFARCDHRIADFCLAWRGKYDAVIDGYAEVWPLSSEEQAAIVPVWWAFLIECACRDLSLGRLDERWAITKLLTRSPVMGRDAEAFP